MMAFISKLHGILIGLKKLPGPPDLRFGSLVDRWFRKGRSQERVSRPGARAQAFATAALAGLAVYGFGPSMLEFLELVPARLAAQFEVEWMEGLMLVGARRLWETGILYPPPTFEYVPVIYAPMHFYFLGLVVPFAPTTQYVLGRCLSLIFLAITQILLYRIFAGRYGRPAGVFMALIPLSFYPVSGFWLDLIRIDNLYIMFLFATVAAQLSRVSDKSKLILTTLLFLAALFSKQSAIVILPAFIFYWVYRFRFGHALLQFILIAVGFFLVLMYWQYRTDGRFWKYMWEIGQSHGYFFGSFELALTAAIDQQWFAMSYLKRMVQFVPAAFAVAIWIGVRRVRWWLRAKPETRSESLIHPLQVIDLYLVTFACGMLVMTYLLSTHAGSYWNNNLPALYGYVILAYLAVRTLVYPIFRILRMRGFGVRALAWLPLLTLLWMARIHYATPLRAHIPDPHLTLKMTQERQIFIELFRQHGPMFFPGQPAEGVLGSLAPPHYHYISLDDLRTGPYESVYKQLVTPEKLAPFRFLVSWRDAVTYPGFRRFPIGDVGIRYKALQGMAGGSFVALYIHLRTPGEQALLRELRDSVATTRARLEQSDVTDHTR